MGISAIQEQHDTIIETIKHITQNDWKVLVIDESSKRIIDNVVTEDEILHQNIANIERIEERRDMNPTMDAIYLLSPQPHIIDCLLADFERQKYRKSYLVWTAVLEPPLRRRIDSSNAAQQQLAGFETLSIEFFPRESYLVTFRDPWSFPVLYHPACNHLIKDHMLSLAQKITGVCVSLGEYPKVRYYRPRNPMHEASVLCSHLARFVQEELDEYAQWNPNFPPPSSRPQGTLIIADRSMDLLAPLLHEFTYQAMAHDLLPIKESDKVLYRMTMNEGTPDAEQKDMELQEKDKVWVENRHRHMKDTIDKLMADFRKFLQQNPNFTDQNQDTTSLNAIKDMLAGLPQFQEMKEAYSLHLTMAQEAMNIFQARKLPDIASVEQTLATGLDEDLKKPKNILDQVVRLLDDEAITQSDRLRLIMIYVLYRNGLILEDIKRLLAHSSLPPSDGEIITNLELLGARPTHDIKDSQPAPPPLFTLEQKNAANNEEYALSRYVTNVRHMLDHVTRGTLDQTLFPYVKPPIDPNEELLQTQGSLRAAKPSWAGAGRQRPDNKQRLIVFMAGGATYSEARACYEVGQARNKDIFLTTSHMLTPHLFIRQVGDLSVDKRRLDLPMERPKPRAPAHLFERPAEPPSMLHPGPGGSAPPVPGFPPPAAPAGQQRFPAPAPSHPHPPVHAMGNMNLGSGINGSTDARHSSPSLAGDKDRGKLKDHHHHLHKEKEKDKDREKHKKKRNIFGMKK